MNLVRTRAHVACVTALAMTASSFTYAAEVPPAPTNSAAFPPPSAPPRRGVAVLARPGAEAAAWALAKEVYAQDPLRPAGLDEARARVLVGQPAAPDAPPATKDLAEERAAIHGDDGASRALLATIASQLWVRALVVVEADRAGGTSARVFLADAQAFDAARYAPDAPPSLPSASAAVPTDAGAPGSAVGASEGGMNADAAAPALVAPPAVHWSGMVASLERTLAAPEPFEPRPGPEAMRAPSLATSAIPPEKPKTGESHPFYTSPWFWGAVGAAVFGGTALYFATRDNSTSTIHLELQVPK